MTKIKRYGKLKRVRRERGVFKIKKERATRLSIFLLIMGVLISVMSIEPTVAEVSEKTIGNIINAETVEVEAEVQLGFYEEEEKNETEVTYAALQDAGQEYISEVEEQKRIEAEKKQKEEEERKAAEAQAAAEAAAEAEARAAAEKREEQERNMYNVFVPTGHSEAEFNRMLSGTGLEGMGASYVKMEQEYGINGVFAVGLAMHESANGYSNLARTQNNFYGMRINGRWLSYPNKEASIMALGRLMNHSMYKGKSISNIGAIYCPNETGHWVNTLKQHMEIVKSRV